MAGACLSIEDGVGYLDFAIRRLGYTFVTLLLISLIIFGVTMWLPGDVARMILGTDAAPDTVRALQEKLGLDRPAHVQYIAWLGRLLRGDLGESLRMYQPIGPILRTRVVNSLGLALIAFGVVFVVGLALGVLMAVRRGSILDAALGVVSTIGISLPEFVTGTVLVILFAGPVWRILPPSGIAPLSEGVGRWAQHMILPITTLALILVAYVAKMTRVSMLEVFESDFVRTARLKGLSEIRVVFLHVLPNALLPVVTVIFMNLGWLLGGMVVVEEVFVFPGIGRLTMFAITERDWPLVQACALVIASAYCLGNSIADFLHLCLDPRLREPVEV